jgi:hypothetical protein
MEKTKFFPEKINTTVSGICVSEQDNANKGILSQ